MSGANNLRTGTTLYGDYGPFGVDADGDMHLNGRKLAWTYIMIDDGAGGARPMTMADVGEIIGKEIPGVIYDSTPVTVAMLIRLITNHFVGDDSRWQSVVTLIANTDAATREWTKRQIAGTAPNYNYGASQIVFGEGGLIDVASGQSWTVPANGAIKCSIGGLLSLGASVMRNGESVWNSPVYLLGLQTGGDNNPSDEIPVYADDEVSLSKALAAGTSLVVTYYPVVGSV